MENASRALLMAGGMLLAILLISVGALTYSRVKSLKTTEAEIIVQEQIQTFNAEYEAYNRQLLRGIDVISVVHKAISNNELQDPTSDTDPRYVNIVITVNKATKPTGYKVDKAGKKENCTSAELSSYMPPNNLTWKLGEFLSDGTGWKSNDKMINYFNQSVKPVTYKSGDYTYYITPSLVAFKSAVFKCIEVKHNSQGRIYEMTFEEKR